MSLSINAIQPVKVMDPVLNFDEQQYYAVLRGGDRVSWKSIISTSYSNGSATFSAPPPSPMVAVSRNVKFFQPVTIDFVGTAPAGQALLQAGYDAPRAYPLSSNMNSLQLDLNNTSFSINMSDTIQALLRYHNPDHLKDGDMSMTPSTLDKSQQYSDLANTIRNPLTSILDTGLGGIEPRGAFPVVSGVNNISDGINPTTASLQYEFTEDLFLSPMLFGTTCQENGFIGLQTFQLTVNWLPDLSRMWCHDNSGGTTLDSITVTLGQPKLFFEYKTPSPTQIVPSFKRYPYYEVQRYPSDYGTPIAPGAALPTRISSSNIQLNSIPRIMYIYARKQNGDLTFTDTDTFFSIEQISINWANDSGLLSSASKQDLYEMSRKNGCNLNWRDWSGEPSFYSSGSTLESVNGVGSVLAIEFGTDLALRPDEAPGLNGTYQLQMDVMVQNRAADPIDPTLYVVIVNEGVFTIENNSAYSQIGVVSRSDVLEVESQKGIDYSDLKYMAGAGIFKNFGRKLKNTLRAIRSKGLPVAHEIIKTAKEVAPLIKGIVEIAKMAGAGMDPDDAIDQYEDQHGIRIEGDARASARKAVGGILLGGGVVGGASARGMSRSLQFR